MTKKNKLKAAAGSLGGKLSPSNFKNNREAASRAGKISAWKRSGGKLADYPLELEEVKIEYGKPYTPRR